MINYYDLCNLSPSASQEEIKKTLHQLMRLWSHRTNAPQMERRQEAERMVRLLEEAEEILLDEQKRKEYDEQLRRSTEIIAENVAEATYPSSYQANVEQNEVTATKEEVVLESTTAETIEELIQEAHQLYSEGKINDALLLAEEITEREKERADVWALIGRCRLKLGYYQEAVSPLVRACDLDSKNATYVYELGEVFEKLDNQTRALEQFKLASSLAPDNIEYKYKLANMLIGIKQYQDGLPLLEQCVNASPDREEYRVELARTYMDLAFSKWITIEHYHPYLAPGIYPLQRSDLDLADSYLKRASRIPFQDPDLRNQLQQKSLEIERRKGRKFTGSWLMAALSLVFLIITQIVNPSILNFIFIGLPLLYVLSALTPKYRIYQKAYHNKSPKTDFAYIFEQLKNRFGTGGAWLISIILVFGYFWVTAFVISIVIIYNIIRNLF